jgi:hypothetical protein
MSVKRKETYTNDRVLESFYTDLIRAANSRNPDYVLNRIHIPHSDVFYVREAIKNATGVEYSLDHVERAMYLEGYLSAEDVFEPERIREGVG